MKKRDDFLVILGLGFALVGCISEQRFELVSSKSPEPLSATLLDEQANDSKHAAPPALSRALSTGRLNQDDWPAPVHDDQSFTYLRAEQLEYRVSDRGPDLARLEAQGWRGGDYNKLWFKVEGEQTLEGDSEGDVELQVLKSQLIAPFWDFQWGARYDRLWGPDFDGGRAFGVIGVQGFSPYEFEVEAALFISEDADVSSRLTATTDILFTQRLILQPRFETELAAQEVSEFEVGSGINYFDLGLRLRYEIKREFAPYIGLNWVRSTAETGRLIRKNGGQDSEFSLVVGLSMWF